MEIILGHLRQASDVSSLAPYTCRLPLPSGALCLPSLPAWHPGEAGFGSHPGSCQLAAWEQGHPENSSGLSVLA